MQTRSGEKLLAGRYQLGPLLGRGGMAEVYEGFDERLARPVAVKLLRTEMAAQADVRNRFEAEARAAARLSHPNVVAVFDTGEDAGVPFIVMERLPGETLGDRMAHGPLDPVWLRKVAGDVLGALAAAHGAGLVHRDVKPGNILIAADGRAKVADFGIAKSLEETAPDLTGTNQLVGTPAYLAPERVDGLPASLRSDLYAVGVMLYEGLAGVKPFSGTTPLTVAYAVRHGDATPLVELRPDVPEDLRAAVERAMQRDPEQRFASAGEMAAALGVEGAPPGVIASGDVDATIAAGPLVGDPGAATTVSAAPGAPTTVVEVTQGGTAGGSAAFGERNGPAWLAGPAVFAARLRERVGFDQRRPLLLGLAALAAVLFVGALLIAASAGGGGEGGADSVSDRLRAVADGLGVDAGPRSADAAEALDGVAEAVDAGGGADAANRLLAQVAAWRTSGELSGPASATMTAALLEVPGADLGTLTPSTTEAPPPTEAPAPAVGDDDSGGSERPGKGGGKGKGKD